jgi:integrase
MILTVVITGRRGAEVVNLKAGDLTIEGGTAFYAYRGKGGKRGRRELPAPAFAAIKVTLIDCGKDLSAMQPGESLWQAGTGAAGITSGTLYLRFRQYLTAAGLSPTGLHVLRHTAPKLRRDAGGPSRRSRSFSTTPRSR